MVATNAYLERWKDAIASIDQNANKAESKIRIHLFTNLKNEAESWSKFHVKNIATCIHLIPAYGWPEATLLRYHFFDSEKEHLSEDILMYMDSDLIVKSDFSRSVEVSSSHDRMVFVDHPGFARKGPHSGPFSLNWLRNFSPFESRVNRMLEKIEQYGLWRGNTRFQAGSWETNSESTAFVHWLRRKRYFYGAIWFGNNTLFKDMCKLLKDNVDLDLKNGIIARWHDESHLNWYAANNIYIVAGKSFLISEDHRAVGSSDSFVVALTKNPGEGRKPSSEGLKLL